MSQCFYNEDCCCGEQYLYLLKYVSLEESSCGPETSLLLLQKAVSIVSEYLVNVSS